MTVSKEQAREAAEQLAQLAEYAPDSHLSTPALATLRQFIEQSQDSGHAGVSDECNVRVLNALEVLERMCMPRTATLDAAEFLRLFGERGMWVIENPLSGAAPTPRPELTVALDCAIAGLDYFLTNKEERRFIEGARAELAKVRSLLGAAPAQAPQQGCCHRNRPDAPHSRWCPEHGEGAAQAPQQPTPSPIEKEPKASVAYIEVTPMGIDHGLTADAYKLAPGIYRLYATPSEAGKEKQE